MITLVRYKPETILQSVIYLIYIKTKENPSLEEENFIFNESVDLIRNLGKNKIEFKFSYIENGKQVEKRAYVYDFQTTTIVLCNKERKDLLHIDYEAIIEVDL